jgi:hypothetical protein
MPVPRCPANDLSAAEQGPYELANHHVLKVIVPVGNRMMLDNAY